ncbi:hypothetical protein E4U42_003141 [Claviceps africana]|uniref:Prolyl 4-hydroxylase alpha subunit Fe(2+) 2OG dioxygenase domain-containing protein n=1 Tax=Claviceps africana TaxID=83212 RepID=A0A8K0NH11_9HYPO|nr:hypothetical protein E4U42_003141 [Claviceps africana]
MASNQEPTTADSAHPAQLGAAVDAVEGYDGELKSHLLEALSSIQTSGSFASLGVLPESPPTDLFVDDVGEIALPLSESQARQMIAKARQAPYGKGSATIVDTTVRNTWELDAEQFSFRNPAWPAFIRQVCARVAVDLGINAPITAEIYKMLIYEKGAMFKAHTDTEKIPNMFGTLVVCLPSAHQGGEVVVKHGGQKKILKTSEAPQSYACWYSDVSHEVLPVTSGFRWVVTYNLALDSTAGPGPSADLQRSETKALRRTLARWLSEPKESRARKCLYHMLDHDYTEASISLEALKTRDLAQVRVLKGISGELPVDIFFAILELKEFGNCEPEDDDPRFSSRKHYNYNYYPTAKKGVFHPLDDVFESEYGVKTLVDLEGNVVTRGMHLDEDDILQDGCFDGLDPDEEDYEGFMGNSGPSATHWYRVTVRYLARASLQAQAPKFVFDAMVKLCQRAWKHSHSTSTTSSLVSDGPLFDGEGTRDMLKAAMQHGNRAFFEEAASHHKGALSVDFFSWLQRWLSCSGKVPYEWFDALRDGVSSAIQSYPYFADQFKAIGNLVPIAHGTSTPPSSDGIPPTHVLDWAREKLRFCLNACVSKPLGCDDGSAMVDMAFYFEDPAAFISQSVALVIDQRGDAAACHLAFLARLRKQTDKGILPMKDAVQFYQARARSFINLADFPQMHGLAQVQNTPPAKGNGAPHNRDAVRKRDRRTAVTHEVLANFFASILESGTEAEDLATLFVSKLAANAQQLIADEFHALWLPFLRSLLPILRRNQVPLNTAYCQQLFSALLEAYVDGYIGHQPARNKILARARATSCSCQDCESLNAFLANPTEEVGYFAVNKQRRMHLHRQLDSGRVDCTHETERWGSPQTLVVTKTFWHVEKQRLDWAQRLMAAREQMRTFKKDDLRQLLGPKYTTIVDMEHLSDAAAAPPAQPGEGQLQRQPVQKQTIGSKRKAPCHDIEIIDLTQD